MAYEKYKHKTKIKGQDTPKRKLLNNLKTGKCTRCKINTYKHSRPMDCTFPCGIKDCPYEQLYVLPPKFKSPITRF